MDWEKQDNELRKLMQESGDFLPEDEHWHKEASWQKIKQAKEPERMVIHFGMLRYAAAACIICLISFFLIKYSLRPGSQPMEVAASKVVVVPEENANRQAINLGDVPIKNEENNPVNKQVIVAENTLAATKEKKVDSKPKIINDKSTKETTDLVRIVESEKELQTQNIGSSNPESLVAKVEHQSVLPETVEKAKKDYASTKKQMRVVHYNQLSQGNAITPPGFVKQNKLDETWPSIAIQNKADNNPNRNPLMFKIELTSQAKKSL